MGGDRRELFRVYDPGHRGGGGRGRGRDVNRRDARHSLRLFVPIIQGPLQQAVGQVLKGSRGGRIQ